MIPDVSLARRTDPATSHEAGEAVRPSADALRKAIQAAARQLGPASADEIAYEVERWWPGRWIHSSIVTACSPKRSGLRVCGSMLNPRRHRVQLLELA